MIPYGVIVIVLIKVLAYLLTYQFIAVELLETFESEVSGLPWERKQMLTGSLRRFIAVFEFYRNKTSVYRQSENLSALFTDMGIVEPILWGHSGTLCHALSLLSLLLWTSIAIAIGRRQ